MLSLGDTFKLQRQVRLKGQEQKMILQSNNTYRKAGVDILIPNNIDFKITTVTQGKDGHLIMIKGTLHQ